MLHEFIDHGEIVQMMLHMDKKNHDMDKLNMATEGWCHRIVGLADRIDRVLVHAAMVW
jgi:hypothetical protein